jgi:hypothetical protein
LGRLALVMLLHQRHLGKTIEGNPRVEGDSYTVRHKGTGCEWRFPIAVMSKVCPPLFEAAPHGVREFRGERRFLRVVTVGNLPYEQGGLPDR